MLTLTFSCDGQYGTRGYNITEVPAMLYNNFPSSACIDLVTRNIYSGLRMKATSMSFNALPNELLNEIFSYIDDPFDCKDFLRISHRTYSVCNASFNARFRLYIDADVKFKGYFVEDAAFVGWTRFVRKYLPPLHPRYVEDVIERNTRKCRMYVVELFGGDVSGAGTERANEILA
jgi:hypothetical protein